MENTTAIPFRRLEPAELMCGNTHYRIPAGQIIFYYEEWENFVITTIEEQNHFTVESYDLLPEGAPYQLINGKLVFMAAPAYVHQVVLGNIHGLIWSYLRTNKIGQVSVAPVDVVLDEDKVFQPDLLFVAVKRSSIIKRKIFGAPDFVVEILSSNGEYDRGEKFEAYEKHGVVEYWIVHPTDKYVEVYHNLEKKLHLVQKAEGSDSIESKAIEGFSIGLEDIFDYDFEIGE